jgi:hypothetical protein
MSCQLHFAGIYIELVFPLNSALEMSSLGDPTGHTGKQAFANPLKQALELGKAQSARSAGALIQTRYPAGIPSSGRIVDKPAITQFWDHFRLDGDKAGDFNSLQIVHVWNAV